MRTTVRARSPRGRRLARGTKPEGVAGAAAGAHAGDSPAAAAASPGADIAYGSTGGAAGPGASIVVESTSVHPSNPAAGAAGRENAVPRRSVMLSGASPAASRCAISTTARSPLP